MIYVTQPNMPPLAEFTAYLEKIWESKWLTNQGPFHEELEDALCKYLGVEHISLFSNGTLALLTALQALHIGGEVITTPFSFVATTHALWWNNIKPVFVDIDPHTFNLDPEKIEAAITPQTTAILPVHVYGNPCANEKIQQIADTFGLKLIYDAAHAFGIRQNGTSILRQGDLSILSFHSTKVYTTIEGGAIVSPDLKTKNRIDYLKNFGFANELTVVAPGINAKLNEIQSAYGLLQLKYVDENIRLRCNVDRLYREQLANIPGLQVMKIPEGVDHNYGYFPISIDESQYGRSRDQVYEHLKNNGFYSRRYFYPLISEFPVYRGIPSASPANLPVAHRAAQGILCLPIYPTLAESDVTRLCQLLRKP